MKKTSEISRLFKCFWIQGYTEDISIPWDSKLQALIKDGEITSIGEYTVTFDGKWDVWVANHPFASGSLQRVHGDEELNKFIVAISKSKPQCTKDTKILLEDRVNHEIDKIYNNTEKHSTTY